MTRPRLRLFVNTTPLQRSREYRWYFGGLASSWFARQATIVAVPYQVYEMTGSTLSVGLVGIAQFVPLLVTSVIGGAMADAFDRRKVLVLTHLALALTALGLAWNAARDPALWPLYALSGLNAAIFSINAPTRNSILPVMVGRRLMPSSLALNQTLSNVAKAVGPAAAGVLIASAGLSYTYIVEAVLFAISALLVTRIGPYRPEGGGQRVSIASIKDGFSFIRGHRLLQSVFLVDLNATIFGMPRALFPAFGTTVLGGDAGVVGLLFSAPGAGALLAAVTSGWVPRVQRQGRAVLTAVATWGVAMAAFGLTSSAALAVGFLAIAGGADVISAVFRMTILQLSIPDTLRGRVSGSYSAVVSGGPRLGDFEAGLVASLTSVPFSVVSGGLACIIGSAAIGRWFPELLRYRTDDSPSSPT